MQPALIDISTDVNAFRERSLDEARRRFEACLSATRDGDLVHAHQAEKRLRTLIMQLACALMAVWLSGRVANATPRLITVGRASYRFVGVGRDVVRTVFGVVTFSRPTFE